MAEGAFRAYLAAASTPDSERALVGTLDSAGTGAYHAGAPPDSRTTAVLKSRGIGDYDHRARKVREADFHEFDVLLGMDRENVADLQEMRARLVKKGAVDANGNKGRVMLYGSPEFGGRGKRGEEIDDPYYGGSEGFEIAFEQVTRLGKGLLQWIQSGRP